MKLSGPSMVYLSEALDTSEIDHAIINKICIKIDVPIECAYDKYKGDSTEGRLWTLIENVNNTDKINSLISVIINEYDGDKKLDLINGALRLSGFTANDKGQVIKYMVEEAKLHEKISDIEEGLKKLRLGQVLKDFNNGVENYSKGNNFQDIRRALEGLIHEIVDKKIGSHAKNVKDEISNLFPPKILKNSTKKFSIEGKTMELEHVHAYGIYSLLSNYIDHYNPKTDETERHFVFFQSVGLIWLLVKRYLQNP